MSAAPAAYPRVGRTPRPPLVQRVPSSAVSLKQPAVPVAIAGVGGPVYFSGYVQEEPKQRRRSAPPKKKDPGAVAASSERKTSSTPSGGARRKGSDGAPSTAR